MRVAEGEKILSVALAEHSDEEETVKPEEADADAGAVEAEDLAVEAEEIVEDTVNDEE